MTQHFCHFHRSVDSRAFSRVTSNHQLLTVLKSIHCFCISKAGNGRSHGGDLIKRDCFSGEPSWLGRGCVSIAHLDEDPFLAVVDPVVTQGALTPRIDFYASTLQVTA